MARRRTARELEVRAASRRAPALADAAPDGEPMAMLRRRGLHPRLTLPDLPFPADLPPSIQERLAERLGHYAFRLFLRGAILAAGPFDATQATAYLERDQARVMAEELVEMRLAVRVARGRYRLTHAAHTFGSTLEWYVARELRRRLALEVACGVQSGATGVGGDLDVVATGEGKFIYLELKSSPPKHISKRAVAGFLRRIAAVRPDVALFVVDTSLRLSDKILPTFAAELARVRGSPPPTPRRVIRETWALTPHLYVVNARDDLVENICRAIAEGLRALAPDVA